MWLGCSFSVKYSRQAAGRSAICHSDTPSEHVGALCVAAAKCTQPSRLNSENLHWADGGTIQHQPWGVPQCRDTKASVDGGLHWCPLSAYPATCMSPLLSCLGVGLNISKHVQLAGTELLRPSFMHSTHICKIIRARPQQCLRLKAVAVPMAWWKERKVEGLGRGPLQGFDFISRAQLAASWHAPVWADHRCLQFKESSLMRCWASIFRHAPVWADPAVFDMKYILCCQLALLRILGFGCLLLCFHHL